MPGAHCFLLLVQLAWITHAAWAQRSPYSLQAAVDELAAKYPLNAPPSPQHYYGSALGNAAEQDYWDEDTDYPANKNRNRHRMNKALAKYLERENYDADHGGLSLGPFGGYEFDEDNNNFFTNTPNEKKRASYFRERDNKYDNVPTSVFRERESQVSNGPENAELTEQFLREIEETQEHEREERYKEALRHLWEKYQQQENDIQGDLFEEKKRMRMPPYYMVMQKKRSYPVLPWLPYAAERKKRFPVAKRSTKRSPGDGMPLGKTDEKVAKELSELFGNPGAGDDKKKRSTDAQTSKDAATQTPQTIPTAVSDVHLEVPAKKDASNATEIVQTHNHEHNHAHGHHQHEHSGHHGGHQAHSLHNHKKRSDQQNSHESREESEESEEREHEEEEESEEHEEHEEHEPREGEEEEEEERKKKREVDNANAKLGNVEVVKANQILPGDLSNNRRKKSIQWSKYFGLDRKKKSLKTNDKSE